ARIARDEAGYAEKEAGGPSLMRDRRSKPGLVTDPRLRAHRSRLSGQLREGVRDGFRHHRSEADPTDNLGRLLMVPRLACRLSPGKREGRSDGTNRHREPV